MGEDESAMKAWLEKQRNKGKDTVATRFVENELERKQKTCPACTNKNSADANFCGNCGAKI